MLLYNRCMEEILRAKVANTILKEKNKTEGFILMDVKNYLGATGTLQYVKGSLQRDGERAV